MLKHYLRATTAAFALLAVASVGTAAEEQKDEKSIHTMEHQHDVTILHLIETAQTPADHETIAKRFDEEASTFDTQAARHEKLAQQYKHGQGVPPKGNGASLSRHCDNIAKNLKASAKDAREMARLHRDLGAALAQ